MNDQQIENEIVAKGKTAPRITPQRIESIILSESYFTAADGAAGRHQYLLDTKSENEKISELDINPSLSLLTFCVLVLRNGFTVTGESACASPENFDPEIGRNIARQNAVNKIWMLEGYLLKQKLSE
ncbi:Gp49 family protein [Citrobacter sp. Cb018]|nr:Gp49 family protein [Citrobacter sp. Cb018]MDM3413763.1 Gp49 family protein [Citrobacter sp. Cb018]MEB0359582.1 Gp49 family protein [Citrobacter freundii]